MSRVTTQQHTSPFVFRFEGQEGRTFWGALSSTQVSEKLIGALSVDGKRFVIADEDGTFDGAVADNDTLDYCYTHVIPPDRPRRRVRPPDPGKMTRARRAGAFEDADAPSPLVGRFALASEGEP